MSADAMLDCVCVSVYEQLFYILPNCVTTILNLYAMATRFNTTCVGNGRYHLISYRSY